MRTLLPELPVQHDVAYVLVQHLDPSHASFLEEILQQAGSAMTIRTVQSDMRLSGGCLYVIPPGAECTVRDGIFHLASGDGHSVPRHVIDLLFASLADACAEHAIAVVLSGTGSDGTRGVRAIKAAGGTAIVQDPEDAEHPGMPQSVLRERLADMVAPLKDVGAAVARALSWAGERSLAPAQSQHQDLAELVKVLAHKSGIAFDQYEEGAVRRRIERRMMIIGEPDLAGYGALLEASDTEAGQLAGDLLISRTSFFRDADTLTAVRAALQAIVDTKRPGAPIRIWVAGCATGEEAYCIAMLLTDLLEDDVVTRPVQILATDVDTGVITAARRGLYLRDAVLGLPQPLIDKYLEPVDGSYRVTKPLRDVVTLAPHDLLQDPPFSRLDLVSCRSVLVYFKGEAQRRLLQTFHYILNPRGYLVLGPSETAAPAEGLFAPASHKAQVFARTGLESPLPRTAGRTVPAATPRRDPQDAGLLERRVRDAMFQHYAPPSILMDERFNALFVHGDVSRYVSLKPGAVTASVLDMLDAPLGIETRLAVQKSQRNNARVRSPPVACGKAADTGTVVLTALPVVGAGRYSGPLTLVVFEERAADPQAQSDPERLAGATALRVDQLEQELASTRNRLQTRIEEIETANEELLSLNEEFQSTSQELQSTNEELQSANEELSTLNEELRLRSEEMSRLNRDLEDILNAAVAGLVVLDEDLRVTRYSAASRQIFDLMPTSIGRPLIATGRSVDLSLLTTQIQQALSSREPVERHLDLADQVFLVRFIPRDGGDAGLVISFIDVSEHLAAVRRNQQLAAVLKDSSDAITVYAPDGEILAWNRGAERLYGYSEQEAIGTSVYELTPEPLRDAMRDVTAQVMTDKRVGPMEVERRSRTGRSLDVELTATALVDRQGDSYAVAATEHDVSTERFIEARRRQAAVAHEERLTTAGEMAAGLAHELNQPLTAIMHFSDLARSILKPSRMRRREELVEALAGITQQTDRAGTIIRNLRRFVGRVEPDRQPGDINEVVRGTMSFMSWDLEQYGITTELHLAGELPPIPIDQSQIEQVLVNMIRNSAEAMTEAASEPRRLRIETGPLWDEGRAGVTVMVHDTGPGLPAETSKLLFNPFQTSKPNGLGMGLWIARSIVEAHGGRLYAEPSDGTGATFRFTLRSWSAGDDNPG